MNGRFALGTWDLHPDGDRIVVARTLRAGDDAPAQRYLVVANWFAELRQALGGS